MVTLRHLVAGNITRLRVHAQVPVDRVAQVATNYGLNWTMPWLKSVEQGSRGLSAEQLLMMPLVLSSALAHRVTLADLVAGEQPVELAPDQQVSHAHLREVVTGEPSHRPFTTSGIDPTALLTASNQQAVEKMRTVREANLGDVDVRTLGRAEAGAGQAEERLAKRLGVPVIVVIAAAASLWGRSLSDERDALVKQDPAAEAVAIARRLSAAVSARITQAAETDKGCAEPETVSA
jgi:hypothetical protein